VDSISPAAWIVFLSVLVSVFMVGVPVGMSLTADYRRLRALGVANAGRVIRRRFFIPRRPHTLYKLTDHQVWIDWWTPSMKKGKLLASVTTVSEDATSLVLETERERMIFRPKRMSRNFPTGDGAATGGLFIETGERIASVLVVTV
jgi:hypothetical protein